MSARSPTAVAMRRIQARMGSGVRSELREWLLHPPEGCTLIEHEPVLTWVIEMKGPDKEHTGCALYDGQVYRLLVQFTDRYPLESPVVTFIPPAPVHPHIYSNGHICLDILYDSSNGGWSPALTINKVALSVRSMLASNTANERPAGDRTYCLRMAGRSPKDTRWNFDDDKV